MITTTELDLGDGVYSSGAKFASSGGGLPDRWTTQGVIEYTDSVMGSYGNIELDTAGADGGAWCIADYDSSEVRVIEFDGSLRWSASYSKPWDVAADVANRKLYVANGDSNEIKVYDLDDGSVLDDFTLSDIQFCGALYFRGNNDLWVAPYSWGTNKNKIVNCQNDGTVIDTYDTGVVRLKTTDIYVDSTYAYVTDAALSPYSIRIKLSDVSQTTIGTISNTDADGDAFTATAVGVCSDGTYLYRLAIYTGVIDEFTKSSLAFRRRYIYPGSQMGQFTDGVAIDPVHPRGLAINASWFAYRKSRTVWAAMRRNTQTAYVDSDTFAAGSTLKAIQVEGFLSRLKSASLDLSRCSLWYAVDGGSHVPFEPGDELSVDVGGHYVRVGADMKDEGMHIAIQPYISGIALDVDDGLIPRVSASFNRGFG